MEPITIALFSGDVLEGEPIRRQPGPTIELFDSFSGRRRQPSLQPSTQANQPLCLAEHLLIRAEHF